MKPASKPRSITPDSFAVAPELLGQPLAAPARRAVAFLIDLILVAILAQLSVATFIACLVAFVVWRTIGLTIGRKVPRRFAGVLRVGLALVALVAMLRIANVFSADDTDESVSMNGESVPAFVQGLQQALAASGTTIRYSGAESLSGPAADSAVLRYAEALSRNDSAAIDSLRPLASRAIAGGELRALTEELQETERENAELQQRLQRRGGIIDWLTALADDLGIGFGWGALYFTAFLTLLKGQTPGKRAMGMRVIRLDAKPIGWWIAFERFGGYFASLSTGLLGFLQIFWDRNRQALHDKAVETVVMRIIPPAPRTAAPVVPESGGRPTSR